MTVMVRLQFKTMPTPATLAGIIATGTLDPAYEDSDILNDEPVSETTS